MLKVTVLVDNNTLIDRYLTGEPGFCLWIETEGEKILFDTGYSEVFISNAQILGLDVAEVDTIILSHGHNDHTWGLNHLIQHYDRLQKKDRPKLIAHPEALARKRYDGLEIGMVLDREVLDGYFKVTLSSEPLYITEKLLWLGEIPREIEIDKALGKRFEDKIECDDFCHDDSALVYRAKDGLVILTGCSHSGICNIINYSRRLTGVERVIDVIGGFHMQRVDFELMEETINNLAEVPPILMHPCHCTDLNAKIALAMVFNIEEVGVGLELNYD